MNASEWIEETLRVYNHIGTRMTFVIAERSWLKPIQFDFDKKINFAELCNGIFDQPWTVLCPTFAVILFHELFYGVAEIRMIQSGKYQKCAVCKVEVIEHIADTTSIGANKRTKTFYCQNVQV